MKKLNYLEKKSSLLFDMYMSRYPDFTENQVKTIKKIANFLHKTIKSLATTIITIMLMFYINGVLGFEKTILLLMISVIFLLKTIKDGEQQDVYV